MSNRNTLRYQFDHSAFFSELMQSGDHFPPLKLRMRDTFNRFELQDICHLFATLAAEARVDWDIRDLERTEHGDENPPEATDVSGESPSETFPPETEAGRDESTGDDAGVDPRPAA